MKTLKKSWKKIVFLKSRNIKKAIVVASNVPFSEAAETSVVVKKCIAKGPKITKRRKIAMTTSRLSPSRKSDYL